MRRNRKVTESIQILLQFRHAVHFAAFASVEEPSEVSPCVVVVIGVESGEVRQSSGGKNREEEKNRGEKVEEEEEGVITEKRKHGDIIWQLSGHEKSKGK